MKRFALYLVSLTSAVAWGQEVCTRNPTQTDVCRVATTISETIAQELPIRLNQSLVLEHIGASENLITMRAVFDYTEARLIDASKTGVTLEKMKMSVRETATVIACRPKTELRAFIDLGGKLQFVYLFSDKAHFLTGNVHHCTSEHAD